MLLGRQLSSRLFESRSSCFIKYSKMTFQLDANSYKTKSFVLSRNDMSYVIDSLKRLNAGVEVLRDSYPFLVNDEIYGYFQPSFANYVKESPVFEYHNCDGATWFTLSSELQESSVEERSRAIAEMTEQLRRKKVITGWRNELFPVIRSFGDDPVFLVERAAYPWFGVKGYGINVNGFQRDSSTRQVSHVWISRRSLTKATFPGMMDPLVAGALPHGINTMDNVVKECWEEAQVPEAIARESLPVGGVSYTSLDPHGNLRRDALLCYDLELPSSFKPQPMDGEVEMFELVTIEQLLDLILHPQSHREFKPNSIIILMDFLIRHGCISPESPGYFELLGMVRGRECN